MELMKDAYLNIIEIEYEVGISIISAVLLFTNWQICGQPSLRDVDFSGDLKTEN